jgi:hypothetical protein
MLVAGLRSADFAAKALTLVLVLMLPILETNACLRTAIGPTACPYLRIKTDPLLANPIYELYRLEQCMTHHRRTEFGSHLLEWWAVGRSQSEIFSTLGAPANLGGRVQRCEDPRPLREYVALASCWEEGATAQKSFVYDMGGTGRFYLLLALNNNRCTAARVVDYFHVDGEEWQARRIVHFATERMSDEGIFIADSKPAEAIRQEFGEPSLILKITDGEIWQYRRGYRISAKLDMQNDCCIGGEVLGKIRSDKPR